MSLFGPDLGSAIPDKRERDARKELREAEAAYAAAEDRLIKARRASDEANREWKNFYFPSQATHS